MSERLSRLPASSAASSQRQETSEPVFARKHVVSVTPAGPAQVFNLTVDGAEEYFANGVLVHNCRYACMSRPWVPSVEEVRERRRRDWDDDDGDTDTVNWKAA